MECYLCKHCKTIANFPLPGMCEQSPTGEHEYVTGEDLTDQVQMLWERESAELTKNLST